MQQFNYKMDLESFILAYKLDLFNCRDSDLTRILSLIEEDYRRESSENEPYAPLWILMLNLSVELKNLELAMRLISKLQLIPLKTTLELMSTSSKTTAKQTAFSYISDFLKLPNLEICPMKTSSQSSSTVTSKLETFQYALKLELEEDFLEALKHHELVDTHQQHAIRLILKNDLSSAYLHIHNYLKHDPESKRTLARFASACGDLDTSLQYSIDEIDKIHLISPALSLSEIEEKILHESFTNLDTFDLSERKSFSEIRQSLRSLSILGTSLTSPVRSNLFYLATLYHETRQITKACCLYSCVGLDDVVMRLIEKDTSGARLSKHLRVNCSSSRAVYFLTTALSEQSSEKQRDQVENLPLIYIKLGLIDEFLQVLATKLTLDYSYYGGVAIETLENIVQNKDQYSLAHIDPRLTKSTLNKLQSTVVDNPDLNNFVITLVILCSTIHLLKLNQNLVAQNSLCISDLESVFEYLSDSIEDLKFNPTQSMISSTNSLISTIKARLEMISDSDIIRSSFKLLINALARKCMVEGQYKNAAVLYNSIDNNVDAIKSLMRLGDTDVVMNFSLLVKDMAVTRLTINYLKHCGTELAVIEEFVSKSRA